MSTRSTLTYGENFHLYLDYEDAHTGVWLEITQPHNTAAAGYAGIIAQTTVRIPLAIWEHIRKHTPADYALADLTDAELLAQAEAEALKARASYRETLAASKSRKAKGAHMLLLLRHSGHHRSLAWQTARNLERLRKQRQTQRELRAAVENITRYSSPAAVRERQAHHPALPDLPKSGKRSVRKPR